MNARRKLPTKAKPVEKKNRSNKEEKLSDETENEARSQYAVNGDRA